ncbi:hypothetical protein ABTB41_19940, partial [Acinetobacter baumannii]
DSKKLEEKINALTGEVAKLQAELEAVNFSDAEKIRALAKSQAELTTSEETWILQQEELGQLL